MRARNLSFLQSAGGRVSFKCPFFLSAYNDQMGSSEFFGHMMFAVIDMPTAAFLVLAICADTVFDQVSTSDLAVILLYRVQTAGFPIGTGFIAIRGVLVI